jgi:hypothetical protein
MLGKIKFSKIALVTFLTVLIWVWTDLALDETYDMGGATVVLAESSPQLWISFDGKRSTTVSHVVLKGPASRITNIKRRIESHAFNLSFPLDAEKEGLVNGDEPLKLQTFFQKSAQLQDSGLTVESCDPAEISVNVVELSEKPLGIQCYDESGAPLSVESIVEPSTVDILVPDSWPPGDKARVVLTRDEIEQAKDAPVKKKAEIILADGQIRESRTTVDVRIPPEEDRLKSFQDIPATIGYCFSENLQGRYRVELINRTQVMDLIAIRATLDAKARYEGQDEPKMILYIYDRDEGKAQQEQGREVHYNFPEDSFRKGDIALNQAPVIARFKLVPLPAAGSP